MNDNSKIVLAALAGAAAGVIAGILAAPASGEETRENLKGKFSDAKDQLGELANQVKASADDLRKQASEETERLKKKANAKVSQS